MPTHDLFYGLYSGQPDLAELDTQFPFFPLDAPGLSLPGPNFEAAARAMGDDPPFTVEGKGEYKRVTSFGNAIHYLYRRALYDSDFQLHVNVKGNWTPAQFVPGHLLGDDTRDFNGGPRRASVMIIGKHPGYEEIGLRQNFVGPTSEPFYEVLNSLGVGEDERANWYITNLVKFPQLDRQSDALPAAWIKDCRPLLDQELRLVRPDYILCLGSHAAKELLGKHAAVTNMTGRVETITIPIFTRGETPQYHTCKVMVANHPAAVYRRTELLEPFRDQLLAFLQLTHGADVGALETNIDHRVIYKHAELVRLVDAIRADPDRWLLAVDAEWHGDHPTEPNAYLRTVQFSSRHGEGICVVLRHQGGEPAFKPSIDHGIRELKRLLLPDPQSNYRPRVGGHFFRADLPWLIAAGIDCRASYAPADDFTRMRDEGGWDTSLAYHATNEAASYGLEDIAARLTTVPRYDKILDNWKTAYCKSRNISSKAMDGYGDCPDWVLHPTDGTPNYACYDADATRRIIVRCMEPGGLLDHDWHGNSSWKPYWVAHRASLAFLEMEMNGILLDKDRVDELTRLFMFVKERLLADFRQQINWAEFNPDSSKQCVAFLFGDQYAYRDGPDGTRLPIRPNGAMSLNLRPVKSTGKRPKMWDQVLTRGEAHLYTPSTDKEVLGIIGHEHPLAMQLRDLKFVSQALKHVLRPPTSTDGVIDTDDDGYYLYEQGLASHVHADGRVRTHLSQTKETGRASSYRPPLQNISKRREDDYARILGTSKDGKYKGNYQRLFPEPLYQHPIRSIFRASPGHVLVEVDYTGAELAMLAWMADDPVMIDHVRRNNLPEEHPDHYDIHSRQAVQAFHLDCAPTKTGLAKAGHKGKRVAAKNVNFGVPYGRMAPAIARQCREEGVDITDREAQSLIDAYFSTYRRTVAFLADCRGRVTAEQFLCTYMGRRRRFIKSHDKMVIGEQERQAQNFPIQGGVADTVSRACYNLYMFRNEEPVVYRLLLQIHDAILFEVPISHLRRFIKDEVDASGNIRRPSVVRECLVNRCPVYPTYLDGTPRTHVTEPYYFGIDTEVQINWGEHITEAQAAALGIDSDLL